MRRALALAARAEGDTSPNPMVGAVVATSAGEVVGLGYHERTGAPHAEAVALERAGSAAQGATLFVTLEPCAHLGRTPPCVDAIVRAGIARVVIAALDEDPSVTGGGAERLREAGIAVDVGLLHDEARQLNRAYFTQRRTLRSFVTLKVAQSLDGAIGTRAGERYALTGPEAMAHVRRLRYTHDAVMVGIGTAMVDDPQLTVRPFRQRAVPYRRIVVDTAARLPLDRKLVTDRSRASTTVAVTQAAPRDRIERLRSAGVEVLVCASAPSGRVDLNDLLRRLGSLGVLGVLCEGGPSLTSALLEADLVDELHVLVAPIVLGTAADAPAFRPLTTVRRLIVFAVRKLGSDALVVAVPENRSTT